MKIGGWKRRTRGRPTGTIKVEEGGVLRRGARGVLLCKRGECCCVGGGVETSWLQGLWDVRGMRNKGGGRVIRQGF